MQVSGYGLGCGDGAEVLFDVADVGAILAKVFVARLVNKNVGC